MSDEDITWIGRTEMKELLENGESLIAGETFKLTEAAKRELKEWSEN